VARDCVPTQLSYVFRRLLERAVSTDAALINYATWNDFPEGHHIAPEINHNFGFPVLLKHYKRQWKKEKPETKEAAVVFFKKYAHTIKPKYFDIPVRFLAFPENEAKDDFVDVVCILNHKADLYFKGRKIGPLATGLSSTLIPTEPGPVSIKVVRGKKTILKVTAPEWITAEPYRTDRLTFVYSSQCPKYYRDVFGSSKIPVSDEYALDAQGVPNWKKRYQFWKK
jgi:hypothetical protein